MKTITIELTDAEYEVIQKTRLLFFPDFGSIVSITREEYIKRTVVEASISTLQEAEANPEVWFSFEPIKMELCEKYGLDESYQKE